MSQLSKSTKEISAARSIPNPAERLLVATLALSEALSQDDQAAVAALFAERDSILGELEASGPDGESDSLRLAVEAETRLVETLRQRQSEIVEALSLSNKGRRATRAYAKSRRSPEAALDGRS